MAGEEVFGSERGVPESVDPSPYNPIVGEVVELLVRADHRKASFYQVEILQKPLDAVGRVLGRENSELRLSLRNRFRLKDSDGGDSGRSFQVR